MASDDNWRTQGFRQSVVSKIEEVIQRSGMQVARNSSEMENHVFMKAKTREEYMNMVAKLILHVREMYSRRQQGELDATKKQSIINILQKRELYKLRIQKKKISIESEKNMLEYDKEIHNLQIQKIKARS